MQALPAGTRNKDVLDLTNAAAKVSLDALGRASDETAWRVERSVLSRAEAQPKVEVAAAAAEAADMQHGETAPTRQRVRARALSM
ncbi:hypothetical protein [Burkholderia vietnamiensis]|uniref:hypothetical protein n=1 Tax=Burkholderia vietnamiensis TaxID=60552 RepID=UPI00075C5C96|nr:hypothetical protein [Burkholderia vietnamiensis]KVE52964.1 hypothetical protein WI94_19330 [Burkholderia vietnamiensis]KVE81965.1 hypothetical protein WJ00_26620 [Burkholderia vietnamiensis]MDN7924694.1 hypothetical protein [Burkholderia vietnamiensis]HDR9249739.1 hypothetical protein [Burkholderia vietnamiensis]